MVIAVFAKYASKGACLVANSEILSEELGNKYICAKQG